MVPSARLELARPYERQILSLLRLPIPPRGHRLNTPYLYHDLQKTQVQNDNIYKKL